jgi:DNA-binding PadR family transcriptional regulator
LDANVNEYEGLVLGVIGRRQPITRYQILRAFQNSPFATANRSKGSLYPLVRRLVERGLVIAEQGARLRDTEMVRLTALGEAALRLWVQSMNSAIILPYDPIGVRSLSLGELSRDERIQWIADAKELLLNKKDELAAYASMVSLPNGKLLHAADVVALDAKLQWLDRLLIEVVNESQPQRRSFYPWEDQEA